MYSTAELIILAKAYLAWSDIAESTLSIHAVGNDKMFTRLFAGLDCTARSAERASMWFDTHWPLGLAWPTEVEARRRQPRARKKREFAATSIPR